MALADNVVAYYKLDESSGNASDSAGSYTLTNNNTVSYSSAKINNGANFGNANTDKSLTTTQTLGIDGGNITISLWVKMLAEITGGVEVFAEQAISTGTKTRYKIQYDYNSGTPRLQFQRVKSGVAAQSVDYEITLGTSNWYHLVLTYNSTNIEGYVNNSSVGTTAASGSGTSGSGGFTIGVDNVLSNYSSALIDEVGVWSRAISSTEVTSLYNSGNAKQYPFGTVYSLDAAVGSLTITGNDITTNFIYNLIAEVGSLTITGLDITCNRFYSLIADVGSMVISGMDITMKWIRWIKQTKNSSTFSNQSKSSSTWTIQQK